jgi:hypothetical protein
MMRRLVKKLIQARRPEFIFSFAYLSKRPPPMIRLHRALWLRSMNTPKNLLIQIVACCRWYGLGVWRTSYRFSKRITPQQLNEYGLTRQTLFKELLCYGLLYSLTPYQYVWHQLYKNSQKNRALHFLYDHQLPHIHHHIHRALRDYEHAVALIGNKHQFTKSLQQLGVPSVRSTLYDTCELKKDRSPLFQRRRVFCKPNEGSQSQDAFLLLFDRVHDQYSLKPIHGPILQKRHDIDRYLDRVFERHKHVILQPFVQDHDALKSLNLQRDLATTTVRIITGKHESCTKPVVLYLQLEIPKVKKIYNDQCVRQLYTILPLHWETLAIDPTFQAKYPSLLEDIPFISDVLKKMLRESQMYCIKAHEHLLNLKGVAFDVILSQQGPVVLEANFNWSIASLYQVITDELLEKSNHPVAQWLRNVL